MKKLPKIFTCNVTLVLLVLLLVACGGANEASKTNTSENETTSQSEKKSDDTEESSQMDKVEEESESASGTEESATENSAEETKNQNNASESEEANPLSKYSSEEIEYARIWLQLGPNQEIDELYVRHITTGTPLNPDDDTSASYPKDVIQLSGTRLVDGSVTYSGNGNGTINIYSVPLRWDGEYPAGEKFYKDIIEKTELVYVETGNDDEVIELINRMNIE